jgi:hypothetical protein
MATKILLLLESIFIETLSKALVVVTAAPKIKKDTLSAISF